MAFSISYFENIINYFKYYIYHYFYYFHSNYNRYSYTKHKNLTYHFPHHNNEEMP
jgi:hypothetical protein